MINLNISPFPDLNTPRLRLRQIKPGDAHEIFALRSNEIANKYLNRKPAISLNDALQFIHTIIDNNNSTYWGIALPDSDQLIGAICLFNFSNERNTAEIGFELSPDYQGKGFMREAALTVINFGFQKIGLISIEACTHAENQKSLRLLECLGFEQQVNPDVNIVILKLPNNSR